MICGKPFKVKRLCLNANPALIKSERAKKASSLYIALSKLISGYVWDWLPSLSVLCKCLHNIDHRQYAEI